MRIAIANDSPLAREALLRIVRSSEEHTVSWVAEDGSEACRLASRRTAELILMDLVMPVLDGVDATRKIMKECPVPILLVTSSLVGNSRMVYEALAAGAVDAVQTPCMANLNHRSAGAGLLAKISAVEQEFYGGEGKTGLSKGPPSGHLVCLGASTGGPGALRHILRDLEPDPEFGVVIVQHLDPLFLPGFLEWLGRDSRLPVRAAVSTEVPRQGEVYLAMASDHLTISSSGAFAYTPEPVECLFRPSVDVFFQSVAASWPGRATGVLLTGMGSDGAKGLLAMRQAGHATIAQDESTSAVHGMPKAAAAIGAASKILPIHEICAALSSKARSSKRRVGSRPE